MTVTVQLVGTARPEVGVGGGQQRGYSLLVLVIKLETFWEVQLPLRPTDYAILLAAPGWEAKPGEPG